MDSDKPAAIRLSGASIGEEHCYFENNDGKVTLHAMPDAVTVRSIELYDALDVLMEVLQFLNGRQITPGQVRTKSLSLEGDDADTVVFSRTNCALVSASFLVRSRPFCRSRLS